MKEREAIKRSQEKTLRILSSLTVLFILKKAYGECHEKRDKAFHQEPANKSIPPANRHMSALYWKLISGPSQALNDCSPGHHLDRDS